MRPGNAATPVPDDFDAFWREAIAALDRDVPADLRLEKWNEKSNERVTAYRLSCAGAKGTRTFGYYSVPNDRSRRWPLKVTVPGYYAVRLPEKAILCELTCSERVAYHRYTFEKGGTGRVLVDLGAGPCSTWGGELVFEMCP